MNKTLDKWTSMLDKIRSYIENNQMICRGDTIILGISGGADSVCLFFVLLELQAIFDLHLVAVHVNHNLRGEDAINDQWYVETICRENGVPCTVVSVDVEAEALKRKKSLEETGREVRQEAFARVAAEVKGSVRIATAHHGNDNAETFLMNLARGTGIAGLTGIAAVRENYIRPLLCVKRNEIEKYLEENKIKYCIDKTNHENIYIRNVIRNQVLPIFESGVNNQVVAHIEAAMEELTKVEAYLQIQVERSQKRCVREDSNGGVCIYKDALACEPEIIQEKVVKKALEEVAGRQRDLTRKHVTQLLELLSKQVGREIHLPYSMVGVRVYDGLHLYVQGDDKHENVEMLDAGDIKMRVLDHEEVLQMCGNTGAYLQDSPYTKYFDYDIIRKIPSIRTRQVGDQLIINGEGNKQSLKKYYITNKVPSNKRDYIPLVTVGSEVLWVIGYRRSSGYGITKETKKILEVQYNGGYHGRNN